MGEQVEIPRDVFAVVEVEQPLFIDDNEGLSHDAEGQQGEDLGLRCSVVMYQGLLRRM